jgi:hypothetical protein
MSKDRIQYLENAIRNTNKQLEMLAMNRRIDPAMLGTLSKQRLHFQQELAKLQESNKQPKSNNPGLFSVMNILDDDEIIRIPDGNVSTDPKTNKTTK